MIFWPGASPALWYPGLLFQVEAVAAGSLAANLPAAWLFETVFDLSAVLLLTAKKANGLATQQGAVNLFTHLLERGLTQAEQFAV